MICKLALEDGCVFTGVGFGASGTIAGEVVFNTAMTGYQEIFTDPSYCGQIVTMTFPLIGNYGVNSDDFESTQPYLSGFVVRELPERPSNYRSTGKLSDFLAEHKILGLAGVDTRALTRRIRDHGALRGILSTEIADEMQLIKLAQQADPMIGANLVARVAPKQLRTWTEPLWTFAPADPVADIGCNVVAIDCGIKHNILRHLRQLGCNVTVAPASASAEQILERKPTGVLVGNGPGDPAAVTDTIATLKALIGKLPIFGICLGHQMLSLALGAQTYKLRFGHHGANLPVLNTASGRVEITSQNHGFAVDADSLKQIGGAVSHINLNDQSVEGFLHADKQCFAVQFHPEASPGPHDADYVFRAYVDALTQQRPISMDVLAATRD